MSDGYIVRSRVTPIDWDELGFELRHGTQALAPRDKFRFRLKDDTAVFVSVVSTNHPHGGVVFVFDNCFALHRMNSRDTTAGGWASSEMAEYLNTGVLALLPDELVKMIQPRTIWQRIDGRASEWTGKLWLLSRTEVFGGENECDLDDVQLAFFRSRKNRIGFDGEDDALCWQWLRTVVSSTNFATVHNGGGASSYNASTVLGVRPCFVIGGTSL